MKISNIFNINNIYKSKINTKESSVKEKKQSDNLQLSSKALGYKEVFEAVSKAPDIREEKVAKIAKQIEEGTYNVDLYDIASKLISKK